MRAIIVLWILLAIVALVVLLLHFSVKAYVSLDGEGFDLKVRYLFFTIYPRPEKKKKTNKKTKLKKNKTKNIKKTKNNSAETVVENNKEITENQPEKTKTEEINVAKTSENKEYQQPLKPKTKSQLKAERKREKAEKKRLKAEKKANKPSLKERWLKIKPYVPSGWKAVKKLLKKIRLMNTEIELSVGKEDAYEAAMTYGKMNAAVYDVLAALGLIFTMHYKKCRINCVFNEKCFRYDVKTCVCVRPSTVIAIAFCTLVNFLFVFLKEKRKAKKAAKQLKKANEIYENYEMEMCENE